MANVNAKNGAACPATNAAVAAANAMHKCPYRHYARQALRVAAYAKMCPLKTHNGLSPNAAYVAGFRAACSVYGYAVPTPAKGPFWALGYAAGAHCNSEAQGHNVNTFLAACIAAGYVAARVGLGVAAKPFERRAMGRPLWGAGYRLAAKKRVAYRAGYAAGTSLGNGAACPARKGACPAWRLGQNAGVAASVVANTWPPKGGPEAASVAAVKRYARAAATGLRAAGYAAAKAGLPANANPFFAAQWGHCHWQKGHRVYWAYRAKKTAAGGVA